MKTHLCCCESLITEEGLDVGNDNDGDASYSPPGKAYKSGCASTCAPSPAPPCQGLVPHRGNLTPSERPFVAGGQVSAPAADGHIPYDMSRRGPPGKHCRPDRTDTGKPDFEMLKINLRQDCVAIN